MAVLILILHVQTNPVEFRENVWAFFEFPGTKQTGHNNEASVLSGCQ